MIIKDPVTLCGGRHKCNSQSVCRKDFKDLLTAGLQFDFRRHAVLREIIEEHTPEAAGMRCQ